MKIGIRDDCRHCSAPIAICQTLGGKWLPFDLAMVELTADPVDAYLPIRQGRTAGLVPIEGVAPRQLEGVRWVAQRHRCAPFFRAASAKRQERQAEREHVGGLADALADFPIPKEGR